MTGGWAKNPGCAVPVALPSNGWANWVAMVLNPGDVVLLGREASVQFGGDRVLRLRVISVCPKPTYAGWVWIAGYEINACGEAAERREVFVQKAGVRLVVAQRRRNVRLARNAP